MTIAAAIFDLDETLLDTSALRGERDRRDWHTVLERLADVQPFACSRFDTTEVTALAQQARARGLKVGLLTHGPGTYASELLRMHGIRVDTTVSGSDGYPAKPDPAGLNAVANRLGVDPEHAIYVGDSVSDFGAAAAASMTSVGVAWSARAPGTWRHGWPDVAIDRPNSLLVYLDGNRGLGPLGEVVLEGAQPHFHWGSLLRLGFGHYALGRYFPTQDRRSAEHRLSRLVLDAKDDPRKDTEVAAIFQALAMGVPIRHHPHLIVSVPPAPGDDRDRFASARAALASYYGARDGGEVLQVTHAVQNYKQTPRGERAALNVSRFKASPLSGETVLLIDDVLTSGAQSGACRAALRAAGCGPVTTVVLAVTQDKLAESCPSCGSNLVTRPRRRDRVPFIGCSNYPSCDFTRSLSG